MTRLFLYLLATLSLSVNLTAQTPKSERKFMALGVAFYNLENLFDTINSNGKYDLEFTPNGAKRWDTEKYNAKLNNMAYAISQIKTKYTPFGPAIIGIAEAENRNVLEDLANNKQLKDWGLQIVHHDSPDRRGIDVGMLYNPELFKVLNVTNHRLIIESDTTFRTRDQMCVTGLLADEKISVIINHWPSRLGGEHHSSHLREAAAALSKHIADSVWSVDPNQVVIIMGDLNDDPFNKSCAKILGAKKEKDNVEPNGFYNPFWKTLDKGIGSLAYRGEWNLFDQIIISGNTLQGDQSTLRYFQHEVLNLDFLTTQEGNYRGYPHRTFAGGKFLNGYSDHYPTIVYFLKEIPSE